MDKLVIFLVLSCLFLGVLGLAGIGGPVGASLAQAADFIEFRRTQATGWADAVPQCGFDCMLVGVRAVMDAVDSEQ